MKNNIWFITGASKGLGRALAEQLILNGHKVAATSRNLKTLADTFGEASPNFLPLEVDLTQKSSIATAIKATISHFGGLDAVVNNAGYGIGGTVEELDQQEIADVFAINVYAPIMVMQEALPFFRKQQSGYILNISSIAGFSANSGWAMYSATKFALTGMTEVLAQDLKGTGIHATVIAPGAFRTAFLTSESLVLSQKTIADYTAVRESHQKYAAMDGKQIGDPAKAAKAMIQLSEMAEPPSLLFLGSDAHKRATAKVTELQQNLEQNRDLSLGTDF